MTLVGLASYSIIGCYTALDIYLVLNRDIRDGWIAASLALGFGGAVLTDPGFITAFATLAWGWVAYVRFFKPS